MAKKFDLEELRQLLADDGYIIPSRITEPVEFLSHLAAAVASKKRAMESLLDEGEEEDEEEEEEDEHPEDWQEEHPVVMMSLNQEGEGQAMYTQSANLERLGEMLERFGVRLEVIDESEVALNAALWDTLRQAALTYSASREPVQMSIPLAGHKLERVKRRKTDADRVDDFFEMLPSHQPGPKKGA